MRQPNSRLATAPPTSTFNNETSRSKMTKLHFNNSETKTPNKTMFFFFFCTKIKITMKFAEQTWMAHRLNATEARTIEWHRCQRHRFRSTHTQKTWPFHTHSLNKFHYIFFMANCCTPFFWAILKVCDGDDNSHCLIDLIWMHCENRELVK